MMEHENIYSTRWWLVRCRPQREIASQEFLELLGYHCVVVVEHKLKKSSRHVRGSGKREEIRVPVMPGHLIVGQRQGGPALEVVNHLCRDRHALGITTVLASVNIAEDGLPTWCEARVRPCDVVRLFEIDEEFQAKRREYHRHMHINAEFDPGDRVKFIDGILEGASVTVVEIGSDGYVVLEIDGSPMKVTAHAENLARL